MKLIYSNDNEEVSINDIVDIRGIKHRMLIDIMLVWLEQNGLIGRIKNE